MTGASVARDRSLHVARDGRQILVDAWRSAERAPRAVIQILHGLGEHPARYDRFACRAVSEGHAVVAHNHRGHGENCAIEELGHFADRDGWNRVIDDAREVCDAAMRRFPDTPLVLLGHSMGSFIAQAMIMRDRIAPAALVLSGSNHAPQFQLLVAHWLARAIAARRGPRKRSAFLNRLGFGAFNRRFAPNRTEFDWLSRDRGEVDRYVADPYCGAPSSAALWADLTGGLLAIGQRRALRDVPAGLPILIAGGEADPVGGERGLTRLADAYRQSGHTQVTLWIYPDCRHELLNELNRKEVSEDWLAWIGEQIRRP